MLHAVPVLHGGAGIVAFICLTHRQTSWNGLSYRLVPSNIHMLSRAPTRRGLLAGTKGLRWLLAHP